MSTVFDAPLVSNNPSVASARIASEQSLPLGERLFRAGVLTAEELESALNQHTAKKMQFGETLLELGFVSEDTLLSFLGSQMGVPSARVREGLVDPAVVRLLPRQKAESLCAIALFKVRNTLSVAMAEPRQLQQIDEIERITGLHVRPVLALRSNIEKILPRCYENNFAVDAVTADFAQDAVELPSEAYDVDMGNVDSLAEGSPDRKSVV